MASLLTRIVGLAGVQPKESLKRRPDGDEKPASGMEKPPSVRVLSAS
jgi:hypothetical protein